MANEKTRDLLSNENQSVITHNSDVTDEDSSQLMAKVLEIKNQVDILKQTVKTLKSQQTADMEIKYDLNEEFENYYKLFIYFIKSISSIYIYVLLGDEYEDLYRKIENLLNVDPFQQQKNYKEFEKLIKPYPNITNKTTIQDIFLYKNEQIRESIKICIRSDYLDEFTYFLHLQKCTLLDFYVDSSHTGILLNLSLICNTLYLDRFKDEDIANNYMPTERNFFTFYMHKFPQLLAPHFNTFEQTIGETKKISTKRLRNYEFIDRYYLLPDEMREYVERQLDDPCKL